MRPLTPSHSELTEAVMSETRTVVPSYYSPSSYEYQKKALDLINKKEVHHLAALAVDWMQRTGFYNGLAENFPADADRIHNYFQSFKRGGMV